MRCESRQILCIQRLRAIAAARCCRGPDRLSDSNGLKRTLSSHRLVASAAAYRRPAGRMHRERSVAIVTLCHTCGGGLHWQPPGGSETREVNL
jgi:hypothetical protein